MLLIRGIASSAILFLALTARCALASDEPQPGPPDPTGKKHESVIPQLDLLTFYKDNYFLTGFTSAQEVKFQFSAKFDVWPNRSAHAVYFAFSQK